MNQQILLFLKFNDIILLISFCINLLLGLLILIKNPKKIPNVSFFFYLISIAFWIFTNILIDKILIQDINIFLTKLTAVFITCAASSFLIFILSFPKKSKYFTKGLLLELFILNLILDVFSIFTDTIVYKTDITSIPVTVVHGSLYIIFLLINILLAGISVVILLGNVSKLTGVDKKQSLYLLLGFTVLAGISSLTNGVLPLLGITIFTNYGHLSTIIMSLLSVYAILRHRLLSVTTLLNKIITILFNALILHILFYSLCFFYIKYFGGIFTLPVYIIGFFLGIIISIFIDFIFRKSNKIKLLQKKYDPEKYINIIRSRNYINVSKDEIINDFIDTLCKKMGIKKVFIFPNENVVKNDYKDFYNSILNNKLEKRIYFSQEDNFPTRDELIKTELSAIILIFKEDELINILMLEHRENYAAFDLEDIRALEEATERLNLVIAQNMLTDEQKRFNEILQTRLDDATEELRKQNEEIDERYRTERDMVGIMGHELRTPLTSARGFLEIVMTKAKNNPELPISNFQHYLDNIQDSFKREIDLVQTLLSTSHVDNDKLRLQLIEVDLESVIRGAIVDFSPEATKKGLEFHYYPLDNIPHIKSDPSRTIEVVNNLLSNAIKYTEKGKVDVLVSFDDKYVYYSVKDTGEGIPEEEIPNIGKKFYRVHNYTSEENNVVRPNGTGLGMYIVKAILEASGGELRIESKVGIGSTFTAVFTRWNA